MTRSLLWLVGFLCPLGLVAAAVYPPPCEVQANLQPQPVAVPTKEQAKLEREAFEAKRGTIDLQPREYTFDRAAQIASGSIIEGNGATIRQAHTGGEFPYNSSLIAFSLNAGWIDPIAIDPKDAAVVTLRHHAAATHYQSGTVLYAWGAVQNGVANPQPYGTVNQRRTVKKQEGARLTLDAAIDRRCNAVCWLPPGSVPCGNVKRGDYQITTAGRFQPGQSLWLTSGKSVADELRGEWVTVDRTEGGVVTLRDRASRDYETASLATIRPIENVTIRNLTIAPSLNPDGCAFFSKWVRNWRFEDCTFGGLSGLAGATDVTFVRCRTLAKGWQLNTTTRVTISDCTMPAISTDEADADVTIRDCLFHKATENAVRTGLDTERMTVSGCTIVEPFYAPFAFGGRDCRIENCRIYARGHHSWLGGDNLFVRDVRGDGPLVFQGGRAIRVERVAASELHLGWVVGGPTQGVYHDCWPTPIVHSTARFERE